MTSLPQAEAAQRLKGGSALQAASTRPEVSVLVPAKDEAENLPLFMKKIPPGLWSDLRSENLLHPDAPVPV